MLDLVLLLALSAPAPKPRPLVRPPLVGEWKLTWGHGSGPAIFRKDGTYRYVWQSTHYSGDYRLEGDTLVMLDGPHDSDAPPVEHRVRLEPGRWRGRSPTYLDAAFRLEALSPAAARR